MNSSASPKKNDKPAIFSIYEGIAEDIRSLYDGLDVLSEHPRDKEGYKAKSAIIECVDLEATGQPGTGELQLETRWEVRLILNAYTQKGEPLGIAARVMCMELGQKIHNRVYSRQSFPIQYERSYDENFDEKASNLEVWVSEFSAVIRFGKDEWSGVGIYPETQYHSAWVKEKVFGDVSAVSGGNGRDPATGG